MSSDGHLAEKDAPMNPTNRQPDFMFPAGTVYLNPVDQQHADLECCCEQHGSDCCYARTAAHLGADPVRGGKWADRPLFASDADVTAYWPDVRPCYEGGADE